MDPMSAAAALAVVMTDRGAGYVLAYLDPGSGSLLIQALIAGVLTVPFLLRRRLQAGIDRLRGRPPRSTLPRGPETRG